MLEHEQYLIKKQKREAKKARRLENRKNNPASTPTYQPRGSERFSPARRYVKAGVAAVLGIGVSLTPRYDLHQTEILSSYGKDFIGPLGIWYMTQTLSIPLPKLRKFVQSPIPLVLYSMYALGLESLQYIYRDRAIQENWSGRFDPFDLVALGAGLTFAVAADKFINNRVK